MEKATNEKWIFLKVVNTSRNKTKLSEASKLRYESQIYFIKLSRKLFFQFWLAPYALIFHFRSTVRASKVFFHAIFETCLILSVRLKLSPPGHFKGPRIRKYPRGSALYEYRIRWRSFTYKIFTFNYFKKLLISLIYCDNSIKTI